MFTILITHINLIMFKLFITIAFIISTSMASDKVKSIGSTSISLDKVKSISSTSILLDKVKSIGFPSLRRSLPTDVSNCMEWDCAHWSKLYDSKFESEYAKYGCIDNGVDVCHC